MLLSFIGFAYASYFFYKTVLNSNLSLNVLRLLNYEVITTSELPNKLVIVGSHTSIYDFFIGLLYYYAYLNSEYTVYLFMKKNFEKICSPVLNIIDPKFKIISVKPSNEGLSKQIIEKLSEKKPENKYIIYLAPEGTRNYVSEIRKGYWYIAKGLGIKISFLGIDFYHKKICQEASRNPEDKWEDEFEWFKKECSKIIPLYPERCCWSKQDIDYK